MVLNDITNDYLFVFSKLENCKQYFEICLELKDYYFHNISCSITKYFQNYGVSNSKDTLSSELSTTLSKCFTLITKLNSASYDFFSCLAILNAKEYCSNDINLQIKELNAYAQKTIGSVNAIIEAQVAEFKKQNLLEDFFYYSEKLLNTYNTIRHNYYLFFSLDKALLEPLPANVNEDEISIIELRSYKTSNLLNDYVQDLSNISSFITQFELLSKSDDSSKQIYLRKFESGSLRIVLSGKTIELSGIPEIIKAITDGIRTFRLTKFEAEHQKEQTRKLKLENDEKELAIINSQISVICNTLGLSKDNPEDCEKIQHLCLPLVRYIHNNPVGKIGDLSYDITSEVKLLEDCYFPKTN